MKISTYTCGLVVVTMLLLGSFAVGAYDWNGSTSDAWATDTNWTPNGVPNTTTEAVRFGGVAASNTTITIGSNYTIYQLALLNNANNYDTLLTGTGTLILNSALSLANSAIYNGSSNRTLTIDSGVSLSAPGNIFVTTNPGATTIIEGNCAFTGANKTMYVQGGGKLVLGGTNQQTITNIMGGGEIVLNSSNALGTSSISASGTPTFSLAADVTFSGSSTYSVTTGGFNVRITDSGAADRRLTFTKRTVTNSTITVLENADGSTGHLTLDFNAGGTGSAAHSMGVATISGSTVEFSNSAAMDFGSATYTAAYVSGAGNVIKSNGGTVRLYNNQTYTGTTAINGGTLALGTTGNLSGTPEINIASGATLDVSAVTGGYALGSSQTLKGNGTVNGDFGVNGELTPGNSVGTLHFDDSVTLHTGAVYGWEADTLLSFDQLLIGGNLDADGDWTLRLDSEAIEGSFIIAATTGTISTNVADLVDVQGLSGGWTWSVGNDVTNKNLVLTLSTIPEPTTLGLLMFGGISLILKYQTKGKHHKNFV